MTQPDLFLLPNARILTDAELADALAAAMALGIRHYREADLYLASICARELANRLMLSGLRVIERSTASIPLRE